jgi:MSHA biogenesis protein MshP
MRLKHFHPNLYKTPLKQRGSMLVIALFVIIVLALLGLTMTRLLSSSSETIIHEVLGQRALNAARAGIECAIANEIDRLDAGATDTGCNNLLVQEFVGVAGLEGCNYKVLPSSKTINDGANNFTYWTFFSTGQCVADNINVTREVFIDAMF